MSSKQFSLGQVLSITAERLCCDMGGVYEILNHVTGDNLFTHVLPRACRFAGPLILEAHPELSKASDPEAQADLTRRIQNVQALNGNVMGAVGMWLSLLELPMRYEIKSYADRWLSFDPVQELVGMVGEERVVVIKP